LSGRSGDRFEHLGEIMVRMGTVDVIYINIKRETNPSASRLLFLMIALDFECSV